MSNTLSAGLFTRVGEPTDAPPGSPRKISVLTERASRREALFHPKDNLKRAPQEPSPAPEADDLDGLDIDLAG